MEEGDRTAANGHWKASFYSNWFGSTVEAFVPSVDELILYIAARHWTAMKP